MPNLLTSLFRRAPAEISRISLSEYVRQRVAAIEDGFAFTYEPYATRGKVEKAEDSYASLASYAYRGDSVVAACMRVRRDLFRQAKFCWREVDDAGPGKIFRTDELALLDKPWPNGTTGELLARMITDVDLCGNSFILNEGDRLRWLRPDWVQIILSGDPQVDAEVDVLGYVYTPGGDTGNGEKTTGVPYKPDEICHWSPEQDPLAFYRGMSWVSKALQEIRGDRAATDHKLAFFTNGATLGPIVRAPQGMTVAQFKEFVQAAEEAHAGAANAYKTMYLGGGAEVTLAAADFRQLDLKSVQGGMETRIAAVAGVHPTLVGLSEGLSGSSLNEGNFKAARRMTAEMTLFALWQDGCGALQAFFDVPKDAELWIRERDIPFLRDEARDRADIFKTQVLAIEAAMRAGFKPDPAVQATMEERLDVLIGEHTGLFSVQMQAPQTGMPGAEPGAPPGEPGVPPPPTDFGALRADLWDVDEDDIERAVDEMFDDLDEIERFDPDQARIPGGHAGGGRWGSLMTELLTKWAKGDGPDDPLGQHGFKRDQLQKKITGLRKQAADAGDHERVARLTPPRAKVGESDAVVEDRLKAILYKDVRAHVKSGRDADKPSAKFTLQGKVDPAKVREVEVENRIRAAYLYAIAAGAPSSNGRKPRNGDRVELTEIRDRIGEDVNRNEVDDALARIAGNGGRLEAQENQQRLTQADRDSAVRLGARNYHFVALDDPSPRPLPTGLRDKDVAVYRLPGDKPALYEETDKGKRGPLVQKFDSLDEMATWAEDNGEPRLAEWARKEGGAPSKAVPAKKATPPKAAEPKRRMVNIADNDWDLDELEQDSGLAGKTAAELKDIAQAANITLPPAVNTAAKRRLFMLESAMERAERKHVGAAYDGVANLRQIVDGRASHRAAPPKTIPEPVSLDSLRNLTDAEAIRDELDLRKVDELKPLLREAGLPVSGRKRDLVDRLTTHLAGGKADDGLDELATGALADLARENGMEGVPWPPRESDRDGIIGKLRAQGISAPADEPAPPASTGPRQLDSADLSMLRQAGGATGVTKQGTHSPSAARQSGRIDDLRREGYLKADGNGAYRLTDAGREALGLPVGALEASPPTPRTVADLRALAKERGVEIPAGAKKADILALLGFGGSSTGATKAPRPSGLPTDRKPESGDFDDLAERIFGLPEARKLEIFQDLNASELGRLARKFPGTGASVSLAGMNRDQGLRIPADLTTEEKRVWLAKKLSERRWSWRSAPPGDDEDIVRADLDDEELTEDEAAFLEDLERAAGQDVTPGHDQLHHYWTRGEGLAKWADSPEPWTTLVAHLTKHVGPEKAKTYASRWFIEVFGYAAGSDKNRVAHGHPPRGDVVGPG